MVMLLPSRAAARFTARRMRMCAPQRQISPESADRISPSLGCGFVAKSAVVVMIQPLMQYPHCIACFAMNACCTGCGWSSVPRPSSVVIG